MSRRQKLITLLCVLAEVFIALIAVAVILPVNRSAAPVQTSANPPTPTVSPQATVWTDPADAAHKAFTPTQLVIPTMQLDAKIIPVEAKADGAMNTPKCQSVTDPVCGEVFWWSPGAVPGQLGNTVIAGHINRPDNSPASFWYLNRLRTGDTVKVTVANGDTLTYTVTSVTVVTAYAEGANNPVLNSIFGPATQQNLNLITCFGDWDGTTFDHRLVVQARLVGASPYPAS